MKHSALALLVVGIVAPPVVHAQQPSYSHPPRGHVVSVLPRGYVTVRHGRTPYYYHRGIWYRPRGAGFVVVSPAIGLFVPVLPPAYTTVWYSGVPYYYSHDVYYRWRPDRRAYVVTEPPPQSQTTPPSPVDARTELFIYPSKGQSEEQQAKDRYECHSWAVGQSGFDPTQPLGGVPESQAPAKRTDYLRAQTACLDARGYSVR